MQSRRLIGPGGIVLDIDVSDPDTPAMVYDSSRFKLSSTYQCATATGMIDDQVQLSQQQLQWLEARELLVEEAYKAVDR